METLEEKVKLGPSKIPSKDKKVYEQEQERAKEQELTTVSEDLWTQDTKREEKYS